VKVSVTALALAAFFAVVQFYTSLAVLSPTPPVGYVFATRAIAGCMVAVLALAALACGIRLLRERAAVPAPSRALLLAWIGSASLAGILGYDPLSSLQVVGIMLLAGIFHLALVQYYAESGVARTVLVSYLCVGSLALLAGLAMWIARRPATLLVLNHGRAAGVFVTANQCAAFAIAFGFVALGIAFAATGRLRVLAAAGAGAGGLALVATFSQAGALGAAAGAVFFAFAAGARRVAIALGLTFVVAAVVISVRPVHGHDPSDTFDRLRTWRAGVRVAELFSLTGVGPMAYWHVYPAIRQPNGDLPGTFGALHPHDAYISLAGETGLVGIVAFIYGWSRVGRAVAGSLAARPERERLLALGVCAGLVAVLVQGIFDTIGVVQMSFVWIPYTALALAAARSGLPGNAGATGLAPAEAA
jgi:O-antigen ligase